MKLARVLAVTRKVFLSLRHDPRTIALMLLAPILAMLVFGFAFGTETHNVPTIIVNHDEGDLAAKLIAKLDREKLNIQEMTDDAAAKALVAEGSHTAAIIFPANFTKDASPGTGGPFGITPPKGANITVFLDTTNAQLAAAVGQQLGLAAQALVKDQGITLPIANDLQYAHVAAKDARFIDSFVPGIMALAAMLFTTLLTLLAFVSERTTGTLDRLRVTPVTEAEIVLGYELAFGIIAAMQGLLLITVATLVYDVLIVGSVALAALVVILLALDAQAIGILVSAAARREAQAVQMIPLIILPTFLLSGIFVPVLSLPAWLQPFSYLLPPTWAIEAMRNVLLRGWGLEHVWLHVTVLAGFAVGLTTLAIVGLRRARNA